MRNGTLVDVSDAEKPKGRDNVGTPTSVEGEAVFPTDCEFSLPEINPALADLIQS